MRLKRFGPKAQRVGKPSTHPPAAPPPGGNLLVEVGALKGDDPKAQGFRRRLTALVQEAIARWENLTPRERQQLVTLLAGLLSLLPLGRLGRVGLLLNLMKRALGPEGKVALSLILRLVTTPRSK